MLGIPQVRTLQSRAAGDGQVRKTVAIMKRLARAGMVDPAIRRRAVEIAGAAGGRDAAGQAAAIREWLEERIHFTRDPRGAELLHTPRLMMQDIDTTGVGYYDCDDVAILASALAGAVGLLSRFVVVGFLSPHAPFRHVWTEVSAPSGLLRGRWFEQDVTRTAQRLPWHLISRRWIVPVA